MAANKKIAPRGAGSVRQRENGTWEARFTVDGRRRSIYADTQREALRLMREALKKADEGDLSTPTRMTLAQWSDVWLREFVEPNLKPSTVASYEQILRTHIKPALGTIKLNRLTAVAVQKFFNDIRREGASVKTGRNVAGVLHACLDRAARLKYVSHNVVDDIELPRAPKPEIKPLDESDVSALLSILKDDERFGAIILLALFCGLRESEIAGLPWSCVDFENSKITVQQQLQRNKLAHKFDIAPTKTSNVRTFSAPAVVMDALRETRSQQSLAKFRAGMLWENNDDLVFTNELGKHRVPQSFYKHFKIIAAKIGRPDARFHDLRHTAATMALVNGVDVKTVAEQLGHSAVSTTLQVYAHATEESSKRAADTMQNIFEKLKA